jgi:peptide/nickel transport system permease protein
MKYSQDIRARFWKKSEGKIGSYLLFAFIFVALYAPFFASSRPLCVLYDSTWYFPLFHSYFSHVVFSKNIDLFFNILGVALPLLIVLFKYPRVFFVLFPLGIFVVFFLINPLQYHEGKDLKLQKMKAIDSEQYDLYAPSRKNYPFPSFAFDLSFMKPQEKLDLVVEERLQKEQHERILASLRYPVANPVTLWSISKSRQEEQIRSLEAKIQSLKFRYEVSRAEEEELRLSGKDREKLREIVAFNIHYETLQNRLSYILKKNEWITQQQGKISYLLMPFIRPFHWQDDVGGNQATNRQVSFMELSRLTRHDLISSLIFGVRISLFVGIVATILSLAIGIPLGLASGYYGGRWDIVLCRLVEVWESMPAFFMLLLIVALLESKSIFLIITVIAIFSWTGTFRYVRAETLRQREALYIDACRALGFSNLRILFLHLLPNAIVPVIALLPFDMMSAITREAGLSFLGLGDEQSCSWGQLMDEGRAAFPQEASLLWPPAIALTILLIAIAFIGDALHQAMDPKLHSE